jgi:hypothetical protein
MLPPQERRELYKRAFSKDYDPPEVFSTVQIPKPNKRSPADKRGFQLQMAAKMLATQASQAHQAVLNGDAAAVTVFIRDIVLKAAEIGTQGTFQRIYAINPHIAIVLNFACNPRVLTPAIMKEYKSYKPLYDNVPSVFNSNTRSGYFYGRVGNMIYNK